MSRVRREVHLVEIRVRILVVGRVVVLRRDRSVMRVPWVER